jgi:hypothetical protein
MAEKISNILAVSSRSIANFLKVNRWRLLDFIVVAAYVAISAFTMMHHEPWGDEAQPWLVARDLSFPDFITYFLNNRDGHASLWYVMLLPFAKLGFPYLTMSLIHLTVATTAVTLFVYKSPFSRITKYLWIFSYFMIFEYVILVRMYAVAVMLIFAVAAFYSKRFKHPLLYAVLVFLLFQSSFFCLALGSALLFMFVLEIIKDRRRFRPLIAPIALMCLGLAIIVRQIVPLAEGSYYADTGYLTSFFPLSRTLTSVGTGFIPDPYYVPAELATTLALIAIFFSIFALISKPIPLAILFICYTKLFVLFTFAYPGSVRHFGFFPVFLFFALWIAKEHRDEKWGNKINRVFERVHLSNPLAKAFLMIQVCLLSGSPGVASMHYNEYYLQFSGAKMTARHINQLFKQHDLDNKGFVIVAHPQSRTRALLPYMPQRKFWYAALNDFGSYQTGIWKFDNLDKILSPAEAVARANDYFGTLEHVFFLFTDPLPFSEMFGYRFDVAGVNDKYIWGMSTERYYLYKPFLIEPSPSESG